MKMGNHFFASIDILSSFYSFIEYEYFCLQFQPKEDLMISKYTTEKKN
jgi:hypothetical protein